MSERSSLKKSKIGTVVSNKMEKSIVVLVNRKVPHPLYKKYLTKSTKFMAHDENNQCQVGDRVKIVESRPLSRRKRWRLIEVLEKAEKI